MNAVTFANECHYVTFNELIFASIIPYNAISHGREQ